MDEIEKLERDIVALENQCQPEQQRKLVTTLFADISGFTACSEKLDAEGCPGCHA